MYVILNTWPVQLKTELLLEENKYTWMLQNLGKRTMVPKCWGCSLRQFLVTHMHQHWGLLESWLQMYLLAKQVQMMLTLVYGVAFCGPIGNTRCSTVYNDNFTPVLIWDVEIKTFLYLQFSFFLCAYLLVSAAIILYILWSNKALKKSSGLFLSRSRRHWWKPVYGAIKGPGSSLIYSKPIS